MPIRATKRKNSPYWYARGTVEGQAVYESTGIPHRGRVREPDELKKYLTRREEELKRFGNKTFAYAATVYLEAGGSPKYLGKIIDEIGHLELTHITQELLDRTAGSLYPDCTPATRNRQFYTPFIAVWSHNSVGQNSLCPPVRWKRPVGRALRQVRKPVSYEDAVKFINACSDNEAKVMFFLFWTGRRPVEAISMECEDVLLDKRWAVHRRTKTGDPIGFPIHESLVPMLEQEVKKGGKLFRNASGEPFNTGKRLNSEGRIIAQCGKYLSLKPAKKLGLGITPYTARHTVSTYLSKQVSSYEKDRILGHSNTISGHYVYVPDEELIQAINKLPNAEELGCKLCNIRALSETSKGKEEARY